MATETITPNTVRHVAKLARLELTDAEVERYTTDLSKILELVEQLNGLDLASIDLALNASPNTSPETVYRPDGTELPLDRAQVFKNAPHEEEHCFRVPKILDTSAAKSSEVTHA